MAGGTGMSTGTIHVASLDDVAPATLYQLLRLRVDVFVVEQACPYPELDGRDLEPRTRHVWLERDGDVQACLRILEEIDGTRRIGRVATAASQRRRGHAAALVRHALTQCGDAPVVLDAQSHLQRWYERLGFVRDGAEFVEDGIPHVPMRMAASPQRPSTTA